MWTVARRRAAVLAVVCLLAVAACSSDDALDGGESAFRNLGKRGDSDVTAGRARAALK